MVSEDSDEFVPGLASIHRLGDAGDLDQTLRGQMSTGDDQLEAANELPEVMTLRRHQRIPLEERNDHFEKLLAASYDVSVQVLTVVVVTSVRHDLPHAKDVAEHLERGEAALSLRHGELV